MSSGSKWMFDVALINICSSGKTNIIQYYNINDLDDHKEHGKIKNISYEYRKTQ